MKENITLYMVRENITVYNLSKTEVVAGWDFNGMPNPWIKIVKNFNENSVEDLGLIWTCWGPEKFRNFLSDGFLDLSELKIFSNSCLKISQKLYLYLIGNPFCLFFLLFSVPFTL